MDENVKWLLGFILTIGAGLAGYTRHVAGQIKDGDDNLHARVNQIKDDYVKRTDHESALARMEQAMRDMRAEMKEDHKATTARLDLLISKLAGDNG